MCSVMTIYCIENGITSCSSKVRMIAPSGEDKNIWDRDGESERVRENQIGRSMKKESEKGRKVS